MNLKVLINKKSIYILSISLIIIAAIIAGSYVLFFTKSAKQFYLESEAVNFKKYSDQVKQIYDDFYSGQKPYMEGSYKKRFEVTANIKSQDDKFFGAGNVQAIFDIINKSKIVIDFKNNRNIKTSLADISLLLEKAPLVDTTVFKKDNQLGFTVPVVLPDKYFVLNTDKLDEVYDRYYKRYGILPIKPKRVLSPVDLANTVKFSDAYLDQISKGYGAYISSLILESDVKYGKNVTVKVGNEQIKGKEVFVTLDSAKTKSLIDGFVDKMSSDDVMIKLTYENYTDVLKMLDEAGIFQVLNVSDNQGYIKLSTSFKELLNNLIFTKDVPRFKTQLKQLFTNLSYPQGLKMTLCIDSSGNILSRKVDISVSSKDTSNTLINIETGTNSIKFDNFKAGICRIKLVNTSKGGNSFAQTYNINSNIVPEGKNEKGTIVLDYTSKKNDAEEFSTQVNLDISKSLDELTMKTNNIIKYVLQWHKGESAGSMDKISGELSSVSWKNNKLKTKNDDLSLTINPVMPDIGLANTSLKLGLNEEDKLDLGEIQMPELKASNTIDLNTISDKELENVENEVSASFGSFYLKNKPIVDAVMGN